MQVDITDNTSTLISEQLDLITKLVLFVAKEEAINQTAELSIVIVDNNEIRELNKLYRNKDKTTDVLSFALQDEVNGEVAFKDKSIPVILGDIIISIDKAKEQAIEYKHSLNRELGFLAVHGLLHLLGYDHMNEVEEQEMFSKQNTLLAKYGLER